MPLPTSRILPFSVQMTTELQGQISQQSLVSPIYAPALALSFTLVYTL